VSRLYDWNSFRRDRGLARALGVDQLPDEGDIRKRLAAAATLANNGQPMGAELRPGNTECTTDFKSFFESAIPVPASNYKPTLVPIEKVFSFEDILQYLGAKGLKYVWCCSGYRRA